MSESRDLARESGHDAELDIYGTLILPEAEYKGEIMGWEERTSNARGSKYAILKIQIVEGPFEGRKVFRGIFNNTHLARFLVELGKGYDADTTAEKALDSLVGMQVMFSIAHVSHTLSGSRQNKIFAETCKFHQSQESRK